MQENQMMNQKINLDKISLAGVVKEKVYSYEYKGMQYTKIILEVLRLSKTADLIPVVFRNRDIKNNQINIGDNIEVQGSIRTKNILENNHNKLEIYVYGYINIVEGATEVKYINNVELEGFLCKEPVHRETPFKKKISDLLLAVNTQFARSYYIPVVAFFNESKTAETLKVGDNIKVSGRLQSRTYQKKINETESETRTAYEVVLSALDLINQKEGE